MRKYSESMPDPTDFSNLKLKVSLVLTVLAFPFLFYYSVLALLIKDPPVQPISARVLGFNEFWGEQFIQVQPLQHGIGAGSITMRFPAENVGHYREGQLIEIVRDPSPKMADQRYEYVIFEEYQRERRIAKIAQSCVVALPFALLVYYLYRTKRFQFRKANPFASDTSSV